MPRKGKIAQGGGDFRARFAASARIAQNNSSPLTNFSSTPLLVIYILSVNNSNTNFHNRIASSASLSYMKRTDIVSWICLYSK